MTDSQTTNSGTWSNKELKRYLWGCERKTRYATWQECQPVLRRLRRIGSATIHKYKCKYCDGWHIGNKRGGQPSGAAPEEKKSIGTPQER